VAVLAIDWFLTPARSHAGGVLALLGLAAAGLALFVGAPLTAAPVRAFSDLLIVDPTARLFTWFFLIATIATVAVSLRTRALEGRRVGEYYALLILATAAMIVVASARDFLLLYLGLETVSIIGYILVGYPRRERLATEASLKYILYGAVASGLMLFGISYLYGLTGTIEIPAIYRIDPTGALAHTATAAAAATGGVAANKVPVFALAMILLLAGLGFKMALVPFHSWCPDVYEGAPTPITAYLAVASKAVGFAALLRILLPVFAAVAAGGALPAILETVDPRPLFWLLSAATMTLGNLVAVWQTNIKRLLAWSSIAHAGYMAMALTLLGGEAFQALLVYLIVYLVMNLGAFFTVIYVENATGRADLGAYRGLVRRTPFLVAVLTIFLLSLLGIPPTAGFMAKFKMFGALIEAATRPAIALAILGIVNTVVSAYYYLKVVKTMVFDPADDDAAVAVPAIDTALLVVFAAAVFVLFLVWTPMQALVAAIPLRLGAF
jgi:NADH-quinone oxidoreductase subunit N